MELNFGIDQYRTSRRFSKYPKIGKFISNTFGTLNIGQYARSEIFKKIVRQLNISSGTKILDLGCGQGEYSLMLSRAFDHIELTSLDIEKERIGRIKNIVQKDSINNLTPFCGEIASLDKTAYFDFIYSIDVFEHIDEMKMPFAEVYKKLKDGGLFFIKMPNKHQSNVLPDQWFNQHQKWLEDEHIGQVYDLKSLSDRLIKEGFQVKSAFYADGLISRFAWECWYLAKKIRPEFQIIVLPFLKLLIKIDQLLDTSASGNTIQVLAQKPIKK